MELRWNITYHGTCDACGIGMAATAFGADPQPTWKLGEPPPVIDGPQPCAVCGTEGVVLTIVGLCLAPFAAQEETTDD